MKVNVRQQTDLRDAYKDHPNHQNEEFKQEGKEFHFGKDQRPSNNPR